MTCFPLCSHGSFARDRGSLTDKTNWSLWCGGEVKEYFGTGFRESKIRVQTTKVMVCLQSTVTLIPPD